MAERKLVKDRYCKKCAKTLRIDAKGRKAHGDTHRKEEYIEWLKQKTESQ